MRIFHELVVDDYMSDTFQHLTKTVFWEPTMGNFETMRFFVIADAVSGTSPILTVALQHQPDQSYIRASLNTPIGGVSLTPGQTNVLTGAIPENDPGMPASYGYTLAYFLGGTSPKAHVRIWVTGRGKA